MKYAEYLLQNLSKYESYTHCYFVAGGNSMHLLDAARKIFKCIPVINEVTAGIAAEYFNETNPIGNKAFALVTAGPGLTNIVTAIAGAYLESRRLLVIGGQVKTSDIRSGGLRQRGIQEIAGQAIIEPISNCSLTLKSPLNFCEIQSLLNNPLKQGPVFIEIPLDVQAMSFDHENESPGTKESLGYELTAHRIFMKSLQQDLESCERPIILLGGGLSRSAAKRNAEVLSNLGIPVMTTWNGMDRYGSNFENYWGSPNTWGQRSSNILIQQSDLLICIGSRLGLQQTGFNWQQFAPLARIYQIDVDETELRKGHPKIKAGLSADANQFIELFLSEVEVSRTKYRPWLVFGNFLRTELPLNEGSNQNGPEYISPYSFIERLSMMLQIDDVVIPCSSGGAFTVTMQTLAPKSGQIIVSNKGLASMGYGLAGAIGAAESTGRRTLLIEGDGGFAQNLQELGTVKQQNLNIKIFLFSNSGYASIRMTQRNYFSGTYLGCDTSTGLGLPDWKMIANAYGIPYFVFDGSSDLDRELESVLKLTGPQLIEVRIDPEQTYFPKITSRILPDGSMESNPLHLMTPELNRDQMNRYLPYLQDKIDSNVLMKE
jgi:acetolactate synthase-1/2/3 large subunit